LEEDERNEEVASNWATAWRTRVLRVLGLQLRWSLGRGGGDLTPSGSEEQTEVSLSEEEKQRALQDSNSEDREEEEAALSSKLVAAVRNAELHNSIARTAEGNDIPNAQAQPKIESRGHDRRSDKCGRVVRFSRESEVTFFNVQTCRECAADSASSDPGLHRNEAMEATAEPVELEYRRSLYTKAFDGPSGHKAKRTSSALKGWPSDDEANTQQSRCMSYATEDVEEDDEEWEDVCDDIAELMCQPRSCLLWSSSW
jgi:hypothetical protein